jgi:hypothetical protein
MLSLPDAQSNLNSPGGIATIADLAAIGLMIAAMGTTIAILVSWLRRRDARAKQRLDLLDKSLENPQLDAQTRNLILSVLANEHESSRLHFLKNTAFWQRLVFAGGWLAFVFCGGMALLSWSGVVYLRIADEALVYSLMGLAVMSLPIAMRELALKVRRVSRERTSE